MFDHNSGFGANGGRAAGRPLGDVMTKLRILLTTALAATAAAAAAAGTPAPLATPAAAEYVIDFVARDGDSAPVTPRLTVRRGATATYMVANDSYSLRIATTPASDAEVSVHSDIAAWTPRGLDIDAGNVTLRADGTPATVRFERTDPATGERRPIVVEVSVRPLPN